MLSLPVFAYTAPRSAHQNAGLSAAFPRRAVLDRRRPACSLFSLPAFHYIATSLFPYFLIDRHRDERSVTVTPLVSADYKCPLAQLLSLHILTNTPGVWGSALPFLKFHFNFSLLRGSSRAIRHFFRPFFSCACALFHFPYPVSPLLATLTKTTGVYPNNSHSETLPVSILLLPLFPPSQLLALKAISGHNATRRPAREDP